MSLKLSFKDIKDIDLEIDNIEENDENDALQQPIPPAKKKRLYNKEEEAELEKFIFSNDDILETVSEEEVKVDSKLKQPVWKDSDEEDLPINEALKNQKRKLPRGRLERNYNELLEKKFKNIVGTPKWTENKEANLDNSSDDDDEDDDNKILQHCSHIKISKNKLKSGKIDIKVLHSLNMQTREEGRCINCVQFHPSSMVAFVAGNAGTLSIFEVDGKDNAKLQSIHFKGFSICQASFIKDGNEIIVGNINRNYFFCYNLISGKTRQIDLPKGITSMRTFTVSPNGKMIAIRGHFGEIFIINMTTFELLFTLKMNAKCYAFDFTPDNKHLISHGACQDMYIWDLSTRKCINRAIDDGCLSCSALAISPSGQFVATGSKQGVVNIYNLNDVMTQKIPQPLNVVTNLVTAITQLKFNLQSEILAVISREAKNALKLVHLPSFKVFYNFPTFQTVINNPLSVAFSPGSGFMSVSNNAGDACLFKLKHYNNY